MLQIKEWLETTAIYLLISFFGGAAMAARKRESSLFAFACEILVGSFTGFVTFFLLVSIEEYMPTTTEQKVVIISLAASSGGKVLDTWADGLSSLCTHLFTRKK